MARNVEIKARIKSVESVFPLAADLADRGPEEIDQDDTFFKCRNGRLKLRTFSPGSGELILYRRADQSGPKESSYFIFPTADPGSLRELLSRAYGQAGRVRKKRTLFLSGRTRIHLDRVESLGDFLELEVVLEEKEPVATGEAVARDLMKKLGVSDDQLLEGAYVDLLELNEH
ncbi:MAG: class IV adenylate cyclase [Acidobacteriota bacterium]